MSALHATELILVLLISLAIAALAYIWLRRRWISDGQPLMLCALRAGSQESWRLGLARIGDERLDWFSIVGPSPRPEQSWARHDLDLGAPRPLAEPIPELPNAVAVTGRSPSHQLELALVPAAYTAVRAWLESAPPGHGVNNVA